VLSAEKQSVVSFSEIFLHDQQHFTQERRVT